MNVVRRQRSVTKPAFALVILSFLLSTAVSLVSLHVMSRNNMREMNKFLATEIYDHIQSEISGPITAARTMSSSSFLVDALAREQQIGEEEFSHMMAEHLSGIEGGLGYQAAFVISNASSGYYTRDGRIRTIDASDGGEDEWYIAFARNSAQYDLDVDNDERNPDDLTVYVNARVTDKTRALLGVCGVGVRITGIQELFRTFENGFGVKINLVDKDGTVQIDSNSDNIEQLDLSRMIKEDKSGNYLYEDLEGGGFAVTKYIRDLDWYLVVISNGPNDAGQFANVIGLNLALCAFVLVALFFALRINRHRTNELAKASYVDASTELLNRRAFEHDKADILGRAGDVDLVSVTADLNGLKATNDLLGHDAGDELIRGAADCLTACFGPYGTVYRTGGDEFAALIHVNESQLEKLKAEVERTANNWSGELVKELSISCGYAPVWEFPDEDVTGLCRISDERMYAAKEAYYQQTGRARRT